MELGDVTFLMEIPIKESGRKMTWTEKDAIVGMIQVMFILGNGLKEIVMGMVFMEL